MAMKKHKICLCFQRNFGGVNPEKEISFGDILL